MTTVSFLIANVRSKLFRRVATSAPAYRRVPTEARFMSDHFKRDIGLLDGHVPNGTIR